MDKIMEELNSKFAGQAAARLDTYAGKMSLLQVAAADATEIIGKGLVDALTALGDDNSIENLNTQMVNLAEGIADVVAGVGTLIGKFKGLGNVPFVNELLFGPVATRTTKLLGSLGATSRPARELPFNQQRSASRISAQQRKLELQAIKNAVSLRKTENDQLKKKTAVDQLKDKFDLERIGLTAALNAATDDETKLRLRSQLAILDNNEALAKKLLAEMNGTTATQELTKQFYALSEAAKQLLLSFGVDPSQIGPGGTIIGGASGRIGNLANTSINNPNFASSAAGMDLGLALGFTPGSRSNAAPQEIVVTVNTANTGDRLSQAIAESIQIATRSGYSTVPAGFL
jgi:hypothetical protein